MDPTVAIELICKSSSLSLGHNGIHDQNKDDLVLFRECHLPGKPFSEELFNGVVPVGSEMF